MTGGSPQTDPRLAAVVSERGFNHMPAIPSEYGGEVRAYESSAASAPHIWLGITCPVDLNDPTGPSKETVAHLTAESATVLFRQLAALVANHYQVRDDEETSDPRGEALRRELQFDKTTIQLILEAVDGADEASGVRRVTAQELATMRANERQRCQGRLIAGIRGSERPAAEKDLLVGWLERVFSVLAADSPVGGVS